MARSWVTVEISFQRDQVQLEQKEIDDLRRQLEDYRKEVLNEHKELNQKMQCLKTQVSGSEH